MLISYLNGSALHACDSERHPSVVDLVVGVVLEEGVGDLCQAQSLLPVHGQGDDPHAVEVNVADLSTHQQSQKIKHYISYPSSPHPSLAAWPNIS